MILKNCIVSIDAVIALLNDNLNAVRFIKIMFIDALDLGKVQSSPVRRRVNNTETQLYKTTKNQRKTVKY